MWFEVLVVCFSSLGRRRDKVSSEDATVEMEEEELYWLLVVDVDPPVRLVELFADLTESWKVTPFVDDGRRGAIRQN